MPALRLALAALVLFATAASGTARVHSRMYCWSLDSELPVPCEDEAEDDDDSGELAMSRDSMSRASMSRASMSRDSRLAAR